jgi:hypothetical protein
VSTPAYGPVPPVELLDRLAGHRVLLGCSADGIADLIWFRVRLGTLFGHVEGEWPELEQVTDPSRAPGSPGAAPSPAKRLQRAAVTLLALLRDQRRVQPLAA